VAATRSRPPSARWSSSSGKAQLSHAYKLPAAWSQGLPDGVGLLRQLEDAPEHFATTLKAGGILDVVERYPCELLSAVLSSMYVSVQEASPACHLLLIFSIMSVCMHDRRWLGSEAGSLRLQLRAVLTCMPGRERRGGPAQAARQAAGAAPWPCGAICRRPPLHLVRHYSRAPCRLPARPACTRMQTGPRQRTP